MEIRVFFFRKSKKSKWVSLITTDLEVNYLQALKIYSMRWSVEVFFKEAKGLLNLSVTDPIWNTIMKVAGKIAIWFNLEYKTIIDKLTETGLGIGCNTNISPT